MKQAALCGLFGLCVSLSIACGGSEAERDEVKENEFDISESAPIVETGCLTSAGDRFVLTALEGGGNAETELYQLIGHDDELRKLVGREVRVTGDAGSAQVAQIEQPATATGAAGTAGSAGGSKAQVRTEADTRIETRQLRVVSVNATGDNCPSGAVAR